MGGYTLKVGKFLIFWSLHILANSSQSTAPILKTPLYSLVHLSNYSTKPTLNPSRINPRNTWRFVEMNNCDVVGILPNFLYLILEVQVR